MIFNINSTRGQNRFLTCVARVTCLVEYNMSLQISNIHQIIIINKIQLRKKLFHSDFLGVDLRYKILFKLDNASFLNIKSEFFDINIMSAHVVYYFKK